MKFQHRNGLLWHGDECWLSVRDLGLGAYIPDDAEYVWLVATKEYTDFASNIWIGRHGIRSYAPTIPVSLILVGEVLKVCSVRDDFTTVYWEIWYA